jgi:tRNA threonylcarbamoyladenosine biosynthesis protein TsaB
MALILNIESSTTVCSVALARDGEVLQHLEVNDGYSHAENLAVFADTLLKEAGITAMDVDAVAVSRGPGSYTGLRIGVSLAKGIAYGASKPLIAVDTLQQMCLHPNVVKELQYLKDPLLCPMLDARRMEVFTAVYDIGLKLIRPYEAMVLDEQSFEQELSEDGMLFFGNGSPKFKDILNNSSAYFAEDVWPSSLQMAPLSEMAFERQEFEDVAYFEPFYLKAFQGTTPKKRY